MRNDVAKTGKTDCDARSRLGFIAEFGKMNAIVKATNSGEFVKFNFAAKHRDITWILADSKEPLRLASKGPAHDENEHKSTATSASKSSSDAT